jgi:hypothetical protein
VFLALYLLEPTSDATLIFYGASMLLAALRGYASCEVLAVSNWLLRRDDQVGCAVFWPIDYGDAAEPVALFARRSGTASLLERGNRGVNARRRVPDAHWRRRRLGGSEYGDASQPRMRYGLSQIALKG